MLLVFTFISLVIAVAPMVAMLFFIWWMDRYVREPLRYVFGSFLWGAFGAFVLSFIGEELSLHLFLQELSQERKLAVFIILVGPAMEELTKGLSVFFLLRYRDLDNVTDGLVYGAASGLGFGMTENFLFFMGQSGQVPLEGWLSLLFIRSVFTAYMHCAATATFGAGIIHLKNRELHSVRAVIIYYMIALILHASWNTLSTAKSTEAIGSGYILLLAYFGIIFLLFVFHIGKERNQRKELLAEEFASGVLPSQFEKILSSYIAIQKSNWFPEYLNKDKYLSLVSHLAMHKAVYPKASLERRKVLEEEITQIRQELKRFSDLIM